MLVARFKRWLVSSRLEIASTALACLLALPSLRIGLVLDDRWHRAMVRHEQRWSPVAPGPLDLFHFVSGSPEETARFLESGFAPWWTVPGLKIAFFRPLSSLTHAIDYTFWPSSPVVMHAESIAWYAIVVLLAARLYRRWLAPISPLAAGIATLFYAIDHTHGMPVGWIANRNALIATTFGLATLWLQDSALRASREHADRRGRSWRVGVLPFVAAATLALALSAGEGAVAVLPFVGAHAWYLDDRPLRERIRSLFPMATIAVAWFVVYRVGHFGVSGSGVYVDPLREPLAYAASVGVHVPLLLGAELGAPTPDSYPLVPPAVKVGLVGAAVVVVACAGIVILRLARAADERVRRASRFFVVASVLSVLPSAPTFPSSRLMLIAGFGLVALLGLVCAGALEAAPWTMRSGRPVRSVRGYAAWSWLGHLIVAPPLFLVNTHGVAIFDGVMHRLAEGVPADGSASEKRLVLVNAPDTAFAYYVVIFHIEEGRAPPARMLMMSGNARDVRLSRTGARAFVVHEDGGFYRTGTELLFRGIKPPMPVGTTVALSDVTVRVTHTTDDGVPDEAAFDFSKDLDAGYVFRAWSGKDLVPFELPRVGETVTFEGRLPDLL